MEASASIQRTYVECMELFSFVKPFQNNLDMTLYQRCEVMVLVSMKEDITKPIISIFFNTMNMICTK